MAKTFSLDVPKDEWTPTLKALQAGLDPKELKRFWGDLGQKLVFQIKTFMDAQKGLEDGKKYRKLKIKWRYHGQKELIANKKNMARKARGADAQERIIGGVATRTIRVTNKTKVGPDTVVLQDTRQLYRSWSVLSHDADGATVGNRTPAEKLKAVYNDESRGHWDFGKQIADKLMGNFVEYWDKLLRVK